MKFVYQTQLAVDDINSHSILKIRHEKINKYCDEFNIQHANELLCIQKDIELTNDKLIRKYTMPTIH